MSGSEKSIRPIRQLSLQPPAPRRQQVRRQRSAEDEKSLQICASPFARGKRGTCKGSERPKVSFTTATFSKILISYSIILARCCSYFLFSTRNGEKIRRKLDSISRFTIDDKMADEF